MKKIWLIGLPSLSLGVLLTLGSCTVPPSRMTSSSRSMPTTAAAVMTSERPLDYAVHALPEATVHTLMIPADSQFLVAPALSPTVDSLSAFAQQHGAIAVINAGFFDPQNQKSTSYVTLQGQLAADPKQNQRLVTNPALAPYLNQIFNRSEFRRYRCGQAFQYDITVHTAPAPQGCEVVDAIGGGPRLLPEDTSIQEGFVDPTNGRDALGRAQPNARTAIGITATGDVVWVMVAQRSQAPGQSGLSLLQVAELMKTLGVEKALNLDGGSSSSLYYQGKTLYGKVDETGKRVSRPVKSVLLVQQQGGR